MRYLPRTKGVAARLGRCRNDHIREFLEALGIGIALHQTRREKAERQLALRIDPEQRGARTVVAEGAGRSQRTEHVAADRRAAQEEPETDVRRLRIPATLAAPRRVQFVGLL